MRGALGARDAGGGVRGAAGGVLRDGGGADGLVGVARGVGALGVRDGAVVDGDRRG